MWDSGVPFSYLLFVLFVVEGGRGSKINYEISSDNRTLDRLIQRILSKIQFQLGNHGGGAWFSSFV